MFETIIGAAAVGLPLALSGVVWLVRLEGRMKTHEAEDKVIHQAVKEGIDQLQEGQLRLEVKFDKLNDYILKGRIGR